MHLWDLSKLRFIQKILQIVPEHLVINILQLQLFRIRQGGSQIFLVNQFQQLVFLLSVFRKVLLERPGNIRHIAFTGIMKQAGENHAVRQSPCPGFFRAIDRMLPDGPECLHVPVSPADQRERMGDILYTDLIGIRVRRFKMLPCVCCNIIAHRITLPLFFNFISRTLQHI